MATSQEQRMAAETHRMQSENMSRVRTESKDEVRDASRVRTTEFLNPRPFILHNRHVREGHPYNAGCPLCGTRPVSMVVIVEETIPGPSVGEGGGIDEEIAAASALDRAASKLFGPD